MNKEIISIAIFSYNSESTILETLNSILEQNYGCQYIELIFGDDGSKDDTQKLIKNWLKNYKNNFHNVILNISNVNKGVVANFNSTCQLATSNWIKPIAADDLLKYNCITELYLFVTDIKTPCAFCKVERFCGSKKFGVIPKNNYYFNQTAKEQFKHLLIDNFVPAPGSFLSKKLLQDIEYPDANLSMEDYPLWLKITNMNIKLPLLDKILVEYRIGDSISNSNTRLINPKLSNDNYLCKKTFLSKFNGRFSTRLLLKIDLILYRLTDLFKIYILKNNNNKFSRLISPMFRFLSPLYINKKLRK
ncbi:glycosyltransferase family 2 protein [Providencia sp. PROV033]|uniref:glycosyltransferase family 2 protein n=1 Tax=Providencia sp. PROV033 TaxID=2949765 RepID=UPI00234A7CDB|nr:glycosyltransferase family 2 protein [Providencia sp. PROV033]